MNMKSVIILAVALVLTAAIAVGGVFGVMAYQDHQAEQDRIEAARAKAAAKKKAEAEKQAEIEQCEQALGEYVEALSAIDARLDVGLTQDDLSDATGDASVAGSKVESTGLPSWCRSAKTEADEALTIYTRSASRWNDCIWDDYCDPDYLPLQRMWLNASTALEEAKSAMSSGDTGTGWFDEDDGETT